MKKLLLLCILSILLLNCNKEECTQLAVSTQLTKVKPPCSPYDDKPGLIFSHGEIVEINCKFQLPYTVIRCNGEKWIFTKP